MKVQNRVINLTITYFKICDNQNVLPSLLLNWSKTIETGVKTNITTAF